jgi:hypothetical protein
MKSLSQTGFSFLHILPVIAIVGVIGFIGVRMMKPSSAATGIGCSITFPFSSMRVNTTYYATMAATNKSGTNLTPSKGGAYVAVGPVAKVWYSAQKNLPNGQTTTYSIPIRVTKAGTYNLKGRFDHVMANSPSWRSNTCSGGVIVKAS